MIGELGVVLEQNQKENNLQNNPNDCTTELLLQLVENLRSSDQLNKKLEALVEATHKFISPTRTFTGLKGKDTTFGVAWAVN